MKRYSRMGIFLDFLCSPPKFFPFCTWKWHQKELGDSFFQNHHFWHSMLNLGVQMILFGLEVGDGCRMGHDEMSRDWMCLGGIHSSNWDYFWYGEVTTIQVSVWRPPKLASMNKGFLFSTLFLGTDNWGAGANMGTNMGRLCPISGEWRSKILCEFQNSSEPNSFR